MCLVFSDIDDCVNYDCQLPHDVCVDGINEYTCACPVGWEGDDCTTGKKIKMRENERDRKRRNERNNEENQRYKGSKRE